MNNSQKYKTLISDTFIFALGSFGSKLILFLLVPLYTNVLSTDQYGTAELVFTIGQLALPFISLTIFDALLRFGLMKDGHREDSLYVATLVFIIGSLATVALTPLLSLYKPVSEWKWYLCAYVIASFFSSNTLIYLKIKDKNKLYAILSILQAFLLAICNILFLVVLRIGIPGYLLSTIISMSLTAVFAFFLGGMVGDLKIAKFDKKLLIAMVSFSAPLIVNNVSWWLIHSSDKIMIEWFLTAGSLGLYTAASKIPSLLNVVTTIFNQAWGLSSIKEYDSSNDDRFYTNVFKYFAIIIFLMCMMIILITKPFMSVYVGAEFRTAWHFVPILLLSAVFSGISSFCGSLYSAVKKSRNVMFTTLIAGVINILINYLLIPHIGVYGAAIGTLSAYVSICCLRMADLKRYIRIDYSLKILFAASLISLIQVVCVTLDYHTYIISFCSIIVFIIIVRKELKSILAKALNSIKKK